MAAPQSRIAPGHRIEGVLRAAEDLALGGHVRGRIESDHAVLVEAGAVVEGDAHVRRLVVQGVVVGDIFASEDVEIAATGQVQGNIKARRLKLTPGGRVAGRVETGVEVPTVRVAIGGAAAGAAAGARGAARYGASSAPAADPWAAASSPSRSAWPEPEASEVVETGPSAGAGEVVETRPSRGGQAS